MATQVEILMRTEGKPNGDGQIPSNGGGGATTKDDKGKKEDKQLTAAEQAKKQFANFKKTITGDFKGVTKWISKNLGLQVNLASMLKQSQVFTNFMGTIFQLFGALVDVMLAPLIPVFFPFIRMMASAIPHLQRFSESFANSVITGLDAIKASWDYYYQKAEAKWDEFKTAWEGGVGEALKWLGKQFWDLLMYLGNWILTSALPWIWGKIEGLGMSIWNWWQGLDTRVKGWIITTIMFGWNAMTAGFANLFKIGWANRAAIGKFLAKATKEAGKYILRGVKLLPGILGRFGAAVLKGFPLIGPALVIIMKAGFILTKALFKVGWQIIKFFFGWYPKLVGRLLGGAKNVAIGLLKKLLTEIGKAMGKVPIIGKALSGLGKIGGVLKVAAKASKAIPVLGSVATLGFGAVETYQNYKKYGLGAAMATGAKTLAATGLAAVGATPLALATDIGGSLAIHAAAKGLDLGKSGTPKNQETEKTQTNITIVTNTEETIWQQTIESQKNEAEVVSDLSNQLSGNSLIP